MASRRDSRPTATGKSALGIAIAERFNGEIINCDSTAVYRGFDIGTDKVPLAERRGIPHHLIDIADPTDEYTAAQFARDAAAVIATSTRREAADPGRRHRVLLPRADARAVSRAGQGRRAARAARSDRAKKGVETLHRMVTRVDPESGARIQPRDLKRLVRALEVYFQTGKPLTAHFEDTVSPLGGRHGRRRSRCACRPWLADRLARRVDEQFERGCSTKIRRCWPPACRPSARRSAAGLPAGDGAPQAASR
jgi:tRNA dimethylallyltransferase